MISYIKTHEPPQGPTTSLKPVTVAEIESMMVQSHIHNEAVLELLRDIRDELIRLNDRS